MKKLINTLLIIIIAITGMGAGYVGTLPNVEAEFEYLRKEGSEKSQVPYSINELDKQNEEKLRPVPRENDDYIDIIIKKDKTTEYLHDINSIILILEKLRRCLNTNQDIQKFNAIISNLIDNVEYVKEEYKTKPESNYMSYNRLIQLSAEARDCANFRTQMYASEKYMPYTSPDNQYTKESLKTKLDNLLTDVNETLFILKNLE